LLSIIESIRNNDSELLNVDDLVLQMIANVWYPHNYFNLSFGKQDKLATKVRSIQEKLHVQNNLINKSDLLHLLKSPHNYIRIEPIINNLSRYVPFRFLTPWFSNKLNGVKDYQKNDLILRLSDKHFGNDHIKPPYRFKNNRMIELDLDWISYFNTHLKIISDFTLWNLSVFLSRRNPNAPNIQAKLFAPLTRNLLEARKYWRNFLVNNRQINCIYSGKPIQPDNVTIDHFLPWRFIAHDQIWNLIPVSKEVNLSKSDNIPSEKYLIKLSEIQYNALLYSVKANKISKKLQEEYSIIFGDTIKSIVNMPFPIFNKELIQHIKPMMQTASNMGIQNNWIYKK
jgi:hypothetical protein